MIFQFLYLLLKCIPNENLKASKKIFGANFQNKTKQKANKRTMQFIVFTKNLIKQKKN